MFAAGRPGEAPMHDDELARLGPLAGTLGTGARVYHAGFVVPDLDEAMAVLGPVLGVTFGPAVELPFTTLETPRGSRDVRLRLAYSTRPRTSSSSRRRPARCGTSTTSGAAITWACGPTTSAARPTASTASAWRACGGCADPTASSCSATTTPRTASTSSS